MTTRYEEYGKTIYFDKQMDNTRKKPQGCSNRLGFDMTT